MDLSKLSDKIRESLNDTMGTKFSEEDILAFMNKAEEDILKWQKTPEEKVSRCKCDKCRHFVLIGVKPGYKCIASVQSRDFSCFVPEVEELIYNMFVQLCYT